MRPLVARFGVLALVAAVACQAAQGPGPSPSSSGSAASGSATPAPTPTQSYPSREGTCAMRVSESFTLANDLTCTGDGMVVVSDNVTVDLGANPHGVLGAHAAEDGVVVRALRPEAQAVRVQPAGIEAELKDPAGLWEALLPKARLPLEYELEVEYPDGNTFTVRDPYSFLPTLGELDLHLAMEGRHEHLYERLGAHVRELDGVLGTAFAVWAPNARSVSVVGDFNSWDGRLHPMRSLGTSGIWELFVPGVDQGTKYKFEIRTQNGRLRLKADPIVRACCQDTPKSSKGIPTSVTSSPWRRRRYTIFARISRMRMVCLLYP